ncbi:MAG: phosphoribosylformylglycinamidine synthase subunit PurS [Bacillota bacterium]|jgi:phosphoribosylformylglycinamidine synthase PurS subunit
MYKAEIYITLKEGVLDPQGSAVEKALHSMNFRGVQEVRIGKFMQVVLSADSLEAANQQVKEMCDNLLANPVIEEYTFNLQEVEK